MFFIVIKFISSCPEVFRKKVFFENFPKLTRKHQCQSLSFTKVAGLSPLTLLKKRLWHRCFPVDFAKFPRTPFFTEHLRWVFLKILKIISKIIVSEFSSWVEVLFKKQSLVLLTKAKSRDTFWRIRYVLLKVRAMHLTENFSISEVVHLTN